MTATARDTLTKLYIDGSFRDAASGRTFEVEDPASGRPIATVADAGAQDASAAVDAAAGAAREWAATPPRDRSEILRRAYELLRDAAEELAHTVVAENGKMLADARGEVVYAADFLRWYSEEAVRAYGSTLVTPKGDQTVVSMKRPVGVSLLITPWNFPVAMITRKVAPALAAGCTVIVKPAPETPLSALALATVFEEAGVPPGVVNVLPTSRAEDLVPQVLTDPRVRKLSFTGSTEVGRLLLHGCADRVLNASLELGGNAPFIVMADADLDVAVREAVGGKIRGSGQACTAPNRFLVEASVHDEFVARMLEAFQPLRMGDGLDGSAQVGPLITAAAAERVGALVDQAVAAGARCLVGGSRGPGPGHYFEPTILTEVPEDAQVLTSEIFGPVAPIRRFSDIDALVEEANRTEHGLMAYLHTRDRDRILSLAARFEVGMMAVACGQGYDPSAPFGGTKESGLGREGGHEGMEAFLENQAIKLG